MPHPVDPAAHATHDALLVAAFAAGDAIGRDQVTATALVATCADCAALHRDLRMIAAALPELPAPTRPRDFRITAGQVASLRPSGWRGILATLAGPRFSFAAPLGTGLAAMGLAGMLLGSFAGLPLGAGGAASASSASDAATRNAAEGAAPAEMPSAAPPVDEVLVQGEPAPSAAASGAPEASEGPAMAPQPGSLSYAQPSGSEDAVSQAPGLGVDPAAGLAVGALALALGVALVVARLLARRLARTG